MNNGIARRLNFGNANALPPAMPEIRARPNKANIVGNNKGFEVVNNTVAVSEEGPKKGVLAQARNFFSGLNPFTLQGGRSRSRSKTRKAYRKAKTQRKNRKGRKTHGRRH